MSSPPDAVIFVLYGLPSVPAGMAPPWIDGCDERDALINMIADVNVAPASIAARRYIVWRNKHAADERLRTIVNRANVA